MAFDPDAYLQDLQARKAAAAGGSQPPVGPFDPNAYLAELAARKAAPQPEAPAPEVGKLESFGRGMLRGATFDFADEISGAVESAAGSLGLTDVDKTYEQARDESRANFDAAEQANPLTSLAGNLGGAAATMLIPGLGEANMVNAGRVLSKAPMVGQLLSGSKIAQAGLLGAGMGAVQGAGASTADTAAGVLGDSAEGAAIGGVAGGGLQGLFGAGGAAAKATGRYLHNSFDPVVQRLEAMGISAAGVKQSGGFHRVAEGIEEMNRRGLFDNVEGAAGTPVGFSEKVDAALTSIGEDMASRVDGQKYARLPYEEMVQDVGVPLQALIEAELPHVRKPGYRILGSLMGSIAEADGDIPKLWALQKKFGAEAYEAQKALSQTSSVERKLYAKATELLDNVVHKSVDVAKDSVDGITRETLAQLDDQYRKLISLKPRLREAADKFMQKGDTGASIRISEQIKGAGVGGAIGSMLGVPGMGVALGATAAVGGAAMRSVSGRLARAKIGESLGLGARGAAQKAEGDAAAQAAGLIPRTLQGTREWLQKNMQMVAQMPGMAQVADQIMKLPDPAAELLVRATLPVVAQFVAPSQYESEFNGKISSPQDRITARRVITAQGLPPSVAAYHVSVLNKSGTLQQYHYAKPESSDYGDELLNFNRRLTEMGY